MRKGTLCQPAPRQVIQGDCGCRTSTKLWTPGVFYSQFSLMLKSEGDFSMEPKVNHLNTRNRTMTHHQSILDVCLPGMSHDLKKFIGKEYPKLGPILGHCIRNPL
jgi:hypothetical protein